MTAPGRDAALAGGRRPEILGLRFEPQPPRGLLDVTWRLGLPIAGVVAGLAFIQFVLPPSLSRALLAFSTVYVVPFGMDVAIPGAVIVGLEPWHLLMLVCYFDICFTGFWVWNLDHLMRFRHVRRFVDHCIARTEVVFTRRPWLARMTVPGLAFFIFIPVVGTGSVPGIILGKLIGMRPELIYVASVSGTAARVALLAFGSHGIVTMLRWLFALE